jgi:hypothetical protein
MFVLGLSVLLCCPVQVQALWLADHSSKESYRMSYTDQETIKLILCSRRSDRKYTYIHGRKLKPQGLGSPWLKGCATVGVVGLFWLKGPMIAISSPYPFSIIFWLYRWGKKHRKPQSVYPNGQPLRGLLTTAAGHLVPLPSVQHWPEVLECTVCCRVRKGGPLLFHDEVGSGSSNHHHLFLLYPVPSRSAALSSWGSPSHWHCHWFFKVVTTGVASAVAVAQYVLLEAASTSETSVNFYQSTRRNIPQDSQSSSHSPPREPERSPDQVTVCIQCFNLHVFRCHKVPNCWQPPAFTSCRMQRRIFDAVPKFLNFHTLSMDLLPSFIQSVPFKAQPYLQRYL